MSQKEQPNDNNTLDSLIDTLAQEEHRPEPPARFATQFSLTIITLFLYSVAVFWINPVRQDLFFKLHNHHSYLLEVALLLFLAAASLYGALTSAYPDFRGKRTLSLCLYLLSLFTSIIFYAVLLKIEASPIIWGAVTHGLSCCIHIALIAFFPAFFLSIFVKRLATTEQMLTGVFVASFAFAFAAGLFRMIEPIDWMGHIFLWHYLPLAIFACLGAWLGPRLYRW